MVIILYFALQKYIIFNRIATVVILTFEYISRCGLIFQLQPRFLRLFKVLLLLVFQEFGIHGKLGGGL